MSDGSENKIALVTGASRGIGKAIALELAQAGATVMINYAKSAAEAAEVVELVKQAGSDGRAIKANIAKLQDIKRLVTKTLAVYKKIDILINNTAICPRNNFFEVDEKKWQAVIDTNLKSVFFLSQIVGKHMVGRRQGKIINIASDNALKPRQQTAIEYGISKAGVVYLTKSLALTLAPYVNVNAVAPGYTDTEMALFKNKPKLKAKIIKNIPLGRVNQPADIAQAVAFLASAEARNITGQILAVDNGASIV